MGEEAMEPAPKPKTEHFDFNNWKGMDEVMKGTNLGKGKDHTHEKTD